MRSDNLVKSAIGPSIYAGVKYQSEVKHITGLMPPGSTGINHGAWVELSFLLGFLSLNYAIGIATDGVIALLTVAVIP